MDVKGAAGAEWAARGEVVLWGRRTEDISGIEGCVKCIAAGRGLERGDCRRQDETERAGSETGAWQAMGVAEVLVSSR